VTKAANGRSSIYKGQDGFWHGWVSFGDTLNGRRRRKHVQATTKREVAEKVARLERQRQSGYVGDRPVTVAEWLDTWIEGKVTAAARARTVEGYLLDRRHIVAVIGSVRVDRLTVEHIDGLWRSILDSGAGPATCAHVRRTLSAALGAAVDRGHLARNPVRLSHPPRYEPREVEPLSASDARKVLAAAAGRRNAARWSVALALGLRQGEALGLRWSDVDLDAGTVTVRVQLQHRPWRHGCVEAGGEPTCGHGPGRCDSRVGGGPVFVPVKSASGRRILGMPPPMVEQMRAHKEIQDDERSRGGEHWAGAGLVFTREDGSPIRKETDSAEWHRILQAATVRPARLHDARHTAATLLLVQGVPAGVAMRLLGHADVRVTARYQHILEETAQAAAHQVGVALWGPS
jgi:integrase